MNIACTSKSELLAAARLIARQEGLAGVSIRRVASECGVAVGSIYNYYPTKADLVLAVVEDFWRGAFHGIDWPQGERFPEFIGRFYVRFSDSLNAFRDGWIDEMLSLAKPEREKGKQLEAVYFEHIQKGMLMVLEQDHEVNLPWTPQFSKEKFTAFVFQNVIAMLKSRQPDCRFFQQILEKLLYQN